MTKNRSIKAKARSRMSKTGEAYTPAMRNIQGNNTPLATRDIRRIPTPAGEDPKVKEWVALTEELGLTGNPYFAEVALWAPMGENLLEDFTKSLTLCGRPIEYKTPLLVTGCILKQSRPTSSGESKKRAMVRVGFPNPKTGKILQAWIDLQEPIAKDFVFTWTEPTMLEGPDALTREVQAAKKDNLNGNPWAAHVAIPLIDLVIDGVYLREGFHYPICGGNLPREDADGRLEWMEIQAVGYHDFIYIDFEEHSSYLHTFAFWKYSGLLAGPKWQYTGLQRI